MLCEKKNVSKIKEVRMKSIDDVVFMLRGRCRNETVEAPPDTGGF